MMHVLESGVPEKTLHAFVNNPIVSLAPIFVGHWLTVEREMRLSLCNRTGGSYGNSLRIRFARACSWSTSRLQQGFSGPDPDLRRRAQPAGRDHRSGVVEGIRPWDGTVRQLAPETARRCAWFGQGRGRNPR